MAIIKNLKNVSGSARNILNVEVPDNGIYTLPYSMWQKAVDSEVLAADINANLVIVNTGTEDLSAVDGLLHLKKFQDDTATSISYDNSTSGVASTNVQGALDAVVDMITTNSGDRFCQAAGFDGNASTGRYLEWNTNVASNYTAFSPPKTCYLKELSLNTNGNSTTTISILKNGSSIQSISTNNQNKNFVISINEIILSTDEIRIRVTSGSSSRPMIYLFFAF